MIDDTFSDCDEDLFLDGDEDVLEDEYQSENLKEFLFGMMEIFFKDKNWHLGGPIPKNMLRDEKNISLILNADFDDNTFDFIHNKCLNKIKKSKDFKDEGLSWEVCHLLKLINDMKIKSIPKKIQPGFLLIYFNLCKGFEIPCSFFNKCMI